MHYNIVVLIPQIGIQKIIKYNKNYEAMIIRREGDIIDS